VRFGNIALQVDGAIGQFFYNDGAGNQGEISLSSTDVMIGIASPSGNNNLMDINDTQAKTTITNGINNDFQQVLSDTGAVTDVLDSSSNNSAQVSVTASIIQQVMQDAAGDVSEYLQDSDTCLMSVTPSGGLTRCLGVNNSENGIICNQAQPSGGVVPDYIALISVYDSFGNYVGRIPVIP
jgi:hypothetical protein